MVSPIDIIETQDFASLSWVPLHLINPQCPSCFAFSLPLPVHESALSLLSLHSHSFHHCPTPLQILPWHLHLSSPFHPHIAKLVLHASLYNHFMASHCPRIKPKLSWDQDVSFSRALGFLFSESLLLTLLLWKGFCIL